MWETEQTSVHPLHDAVQPAITEPQHSLPRPPLSTTAVPPPVAEVAEELEVVTQPHICFKSLIKMRERPSTSRQRAKPPSYHLTSDAHFSFIGEKGGKTREEPEATEDCLSCAVCVHWFDESCAEDNGLLEDDGSLTCKDCLFPENE